MEFTMTKPINLMEKKDLSYKPKKVDEDKQKEIDALEAQAAELSKKLKTAEGKEASDLKDKIKNLNDKMSALKGTSESTEDDKDELTADAKDNDSDDKPESLTKIGQLLAKLDEDMEGSKRSGFTDHAYAEEHGTKGTHNGVSGHHHKGYFHYKKTGSPLGGKYYKIKVKKDKK